MKEIMCFSLPTLTLDISRFILMTSAKGSINNEGDRGTPVCSPCVGFNHINEVGA